MKKLVFSLIIFFYAANVFSQSDSTQYLFHKLDYNYLQFTAGYEGIGFGPYDYMNGMTITLIGGAFGNKIAFGADMDAGSRAKTTFIPGESYPQTADYLAMSFTVEPLIKPKNLINFSIPMKIGYGSASRWDTAMDYAVPWIAGYSSSALGYQVTEYSDNFFVGSIGADAFVNLWKPLSLGFGGSYRYSVAMRKSKHNDNYSGISGFVMLRWKFDTKAYYKKAMKRQQDMLKAREDAGS